MANITHWLEADELPKCQRCAAAADERSFLCEDHAGEADEEVDTLREQLRGAVDALDAVRELAAGVDDMHEDADAYVSVRTLKAILDRAGGGRNAG